MSSCDKPLLGICIPTYNRAKAFEVDLTHLVEICGLRDIEIYISDNCSPDNTQQVCERFQNKYNNVHYYRQEKNIGPDDNFEFVLKMAKTKYRWLMADMTYIDDIDTLIEDLQQNEYDAYIANCAFDRARFLPTETILFDNTIDLLRDIGWHLTWISSMIYNESLINAFDFNRYKNSSFNQLALIFETTANRKCNIKFNPQLLLGVVPMKKQSDWQNHIFDVFYKQLYDVLMSLPIYYPISDKITCFCKHTRFCDLCSTHDHYIRYLNHKISKIDVKNNRFYIKQAGYNNYNVLFLITSFPASLWRIISIIGLLLKGKTQYIRKI